MGRLYEGLTMKTLMRDRRSGVMHSMVYYGFIVLFLGTVTLEIDHLLPADLKFLEGNVYLGYSAILDLAGLVYLGGLARRRWDPLRAETLEAPLQDQAPGHADPRQCWR